MALCHKRISNLSFLALVLATIFVSVNSYANLAPRNDTYYYLNNEDVNIEIGLQEGIVTGQFDFRARNAFSASGDRIFPDFVLPVYGGEDDESVDRPEISIDGEYEHVSYSLRPSWIEEPFVPEKQRIHWFGVSSSNFHRTSWNGFGGPVTISGKIKYKQKILVKDGIRYFTYLPLIPQDEREDKDASGKRQIRLTPVKGYRLELESQLKKDTFHYEGNVLVVNPQHVVAIHVKLLPE